LSVKAKAVSISVAAAAALFDEQANEAGPAKDRMDFIILREGRRGDLEGGSGEGIRCPIGQ
jgi:hypothetical protein